MSPPSSSDDEPTLLLVQRMQAGEDPEGNFEKLFRRERQRVLLYFRASGCNASDSEDLTQDTFLRVYQHIGELQNASQFDRWLSAIMINVFRNAIRRRKAAKRDFREVPLDDLDAAGDRDPALAVQPESLEKSLEQEIEDALAIAIAKLPPKRRQCLLLRVFQGLSYKDIAQLMGISVGSVSAHLHQARNSIAEAMTDSAPHPPKGIP